MTKPQSVNLTRDQFAAALSDAHKSVSEVSKETGVPRTYLSEFRTGDRTLKPEFHAKLRAYFEDLGVDFGEAPAADNDGDKSDGASSTHPNLNATTAARDYFPIASSVPKSVIRSAMKVMDDGNSRLVVLMKQPVKRDTSSMGTLFGESDFEEEAKAALQEALMLCAQNFIVFLRLRGWPMLGLASAKGDEETVGSVIFHTFRKKLVEAGLVKAGDAAGSGTGAEIETSAVAEHAPDPDTAPIAELA